MVGNNASAITTRRLLQLDDEPVGNRPPENERLVANAVHCVMAYGILDICQWAATGTRQLQEGRDRLEEKVNLDKLVRFHSASMANQQLTCPHRKCRR
jgi:hypothetical protein